MDGVEIVAARGGGEQLYTRVQRLVEPQGFDVVLGHAEQERDAVVGTHLGEGACGVACGSHHQHLVFLGFAQAGAHGIGLGFLKGAGAHFDALGGPPAAECDVEVVQSQLFGQFLTFIGDGAGGVLQSPLDGHPVGELVQSHTVVAQMQLFLLEDGSHQARRLAFRIVQHPSFIFKDAAIGHVHQLIFSHVCKF